MTTLPEAPPPTPLSSDVPTSPAPPTPTTTTGKPIHSLVLDTGPLIKNDPPVSALRAKVEQLYITPSVVPEIRDAATRARVETTLMPFVTVRAPSARGVAAIRDFSRRTGDLAVLSKQDIDVLALGYDLECERNGGDWRLRASPDQKRVNGKPPQRMDVSVADGEAVREKRAGEDGDELETSHESLDLAADASVQETLEKLSIGDSAEVQTTEPAIESAEPAEIDTQEAVVEDEENKRDDDDDDDASDDGAASDDDGGWITPSNVKKHKAHDDNASTPSKTPQRILQAAVLTSDFAMQNVALRMNLNLMTPSLTRITQLKTWVLRCHGCFKTTRDMERQFCPSCGQATLIRTSCSTDQSGRFRVHLKHGFQWNNRGNVYSVPRPVHGSANGRLPKHLGGGQNNWGASLILAEDQKEFVRAADERRRQKKKKDLMDDEYLPGILTGDRSSGGKVRVGAGRTVNSRRRR